MITHKSTDTLYKKDTLGRIRIWRAEVVETDEGDIEQRTYSGVESGTIKEHITNPKATTTMGPLLVAESKIQTAYDKKSKDGYFLTREEAEAYQPNKAMLLHRWDKYSNKMTYPCLVQPKLDGVCAIYVD